MPPRRIKIEEAFVTMPIRLKGKWLERAGFKPSTHAEVIGTL